MPSTHSVQEVSDPEHREQGGVQAVQLSSGLIIPLLVTLSQTQSPSSEGVSENGALHFVQNPSYHLQVEHLVWHFRHAFYFLKNPGLSQTHSPVMRSSVKLS